MTCPIGGCSFAEMPDRPVIDARLFWRADWDASVVTLEAVPVSSDDPDAFDIRRFAEVATVLRHGDAHESLLFSDGVHHLQFEIVAGSVMAGPVRLHYRLPGFRLVEIQTLTLRRLAQFWRLGRFSPSLFPPEPRARRWIMALQAYDGMIAGASHRDIAVALFGDKAVRDDWTGHSDYMRSRVRRSVYAGCALVRGGYRDVLRGTGTAAWTETTKGSGVEPP